ncbi:DMT family transporter [Dinoroseobacter sp. S124A]|uniref:DMT family transporter n=1 Tax=Dinoroseobacter sp. S124A TaxID=3415128 RepID=UPI003C7D47A4
MHYIPLIGAIFAEVVATSALQASQQFTRIGPSITVVIGYGISFYLLSLTLKVMPLGIVYALWSGMGLMMMAGIGWLIFGQRLDLPAVLGLVLILAGILIINLFSETATH